MLSALSVPPSQRATKCSAVHNGGATHASVTLIENSTWTWTENSFMHCSAQGSGGANHHVLGARLRTSVYWKDCFFNDCSASTRGALSLITTSEASMTTISSCQFYACKASDVSAIVLDAALFNHSLVYFDELLFDAKTYEGLRRDASISNSTVGVFLDNTTSLSSVTFDQIAFRDITVKEALILVNHRQPSISHGTLTLLNVSQSRSPATLLKQVPFAFPVNVSCALQADAILIGYQCASMNLEILTV